MRCAIRLEGHERMAEGFSPRTDAAGEAAHPFTRRGGIAKRAALWTDGGADHRSYGTGGKKHLGMQAGLDRIAASLSASGM